VFDSSIFHTKVIYNEAESDGTPFVVPESSRELRVEQRVEPRIKSRVKPRVEPRVEQRVEQRVE